MYKQMSEVEAGDLVVVHGESLLVKKVVVGNPFISLEIAESGKVIFGLPFWQIAVAGTVDLGQYVQLPLLEVSHG